MREQVLSSDPWVVVFDNCLSKREVDALTKNGADQGFEVSIDAGAKGADGKFRKIVSEVFIVPMR